MVLNAATAAAVDLRVDIGVTDSPSFTSVSPNDVQAGYSAFNADPKFNGAGSTDFTNYLNVSHVISGVTVSMAGGGNGLAFYDGPDVAGPLGDLAEDGAYVVDDDLTLRFTGLPAGTYQMTMYHHYASQTVAPPPFDIYAGSSPEVLVAADVAVSSGYNPSSITTSSFLVTTDGLGLLVRLDGQFVPVAQQSIPVYLNAFTLINVPEPGSACLLVSGAGLLAFWRYRRRKSRAA
jgi:hypothetical protein